MEKTTSSPPRVAIRSVMDQPEGDHLMSLLRKLL